MQCAAGAIVCTVQANARGEPASCSRVVSCACEVNRGKAGPLPSFWQPGNVRQPHTTTIRWGRGTRPDPFLGVDEGHRSRATAGSLAVERPPGPCPGPFLSSSPMTPCRPIPFAPAGSLPRPRIATRPTTAFPSSSRVTTPFFLQACNYISHHRAWPHAYPVLPWMFFFVGTTPKIVATRFVNC